MDFYIDPRSYTFFNDGATAYLGCKETGEAFNLPPSISKDEAFQILEEVNRVFRHGFQFGLTINLGTSLSEEDEG